MQVHTPTKADDQLVAAVRRWLHLGMSRELRIAVAMLSFCMRSVAFSAVAHIGAVVWRGRMKHTYGIM